MAEKTTHDESVAALRARIKQLEAALDREREANRAAPKTSSDRTTRARESRSDSDDTSRRVADSATATTRRARDGAARLVRGKTLAAFEGVRAFSDSITAFADAVISRNEGNDRNVRDLVSDLPGDIASGFADAFDNFVDVPSRASERFSKSYREGADTPARKRSARDDDESPATQAVHDAAAETEAATTTKS